MRTAWPTLVGASLALLLVGDLHHEPIEARIAAACRVYREREAELATKYDGLWIAVFSDGSVYADDDDRALFERLRVERPDMGFLMAQMVPGIPAQ